MSLKSKVPLSEMVESEINKIQEDLVGVDESLRRLSGSFSSNTTRQESRDAVGTRRNDEPPAKRVPPPGGVFARLGGVAEGGSERRSQFNGDSKPRRRSIMNPESAETFEGPRVRRLSARAEGTGLIVRPKRQTSQQYPSEDEMSPEEHHETSGKNSLPKPAVASSISRAVGSQSRMEAATLVTADRASRDRNRRMFGALLGTLQSFRKDEAKQRDKEEQRMAVEKKLEKKGQEEQERMKREKRRLLEERRLKLLRVQQLADHAQRVKEHEKWAEYQMQLTNFIRTKAAPSIFWLPKNSCDATDDLIEDTAHGIREEVAARREQLEGELQDMTEGLPSKHHRHRHDELPHSDEDGDLEYRDGETGRAVVRRGKGKDEGGSSVDRSVDARDMLLDSRRQRANGDAGNRKRLRSESDVMCGRMVVQVGSGDRVVEVLENNERPAAERHRKDAGASSQVKSLKIKVERDTGPSEKESRKITIESSEKNNEKSKKRKLKDDSYSNDIEDEVSMMRRRIVEKARRLVKEEKVGSEVIQNGKTEESARRKRKPSYEVQEATKTSNDKSTTEVTKVIKDEPKDKRTSNKKDAAENEHDSNATGHDENVEDDATLDEIGARLEGEDVLQVRVESEEIDNEENEGDPVSVGELQLTVDPKDSLLLEAAIEKENVSTGTPKVVKRNQESTVTSEDRTNQISSTHLRSSSGRSDREKKNRSDLGKESRAVTKKPRIDTTALKQDLLAITRSNQEKMDSRSRKAAQAVEANETTVDRKKSNESIEKTSEKKDDGEKHSNNERKETENSEPRTNKMGLTSSVEVAEENLDAQQKNPASVKDTDEDLDGQQGLEKSKSSKKRSERIKSGDKAPPAENIDVKKDVKIAKRTNEESKTGDGRGNTNKAKELEKKNKSLEVGESSKNKVSSDKERSRPKAKEASDFGKHSKNVLKVATPKSEKKRRDKVEEDSDSSSDEDSSDSDSSSDSSSDSDSSVDSDEEERRDLPKTKKRDSGSRTVASGHGHQKGKHSDERSKSSSGTKKSTSRR